MKNCELQNSANHRVFERNLRPRLVQGHVCLSVHTTPMPTPPSSHVWIGWWRRKMAVRACLEGRCLAVGRGYLPFERGAMVG
ncbi:hypothetical protein KP509_38G038500 [Ceratopteris richardii]|uniref:Uncharacterized protein n=1 Tax=Ceratopteris richardii TaxID=49495 RepID=A0A8T2Q3Y3_CERRI|nr:hypothetical protein KP509_38G038500 [Ceratopteris richardii]